MIHPDTHALFAHSLRVFCAEVVRAPWVHRVGMLRLFVAWVLHPCEDDDERAALRSMLRDRLRRERGTMRITALLRDARCSVCGWRLEPHASVYCGPCRRRLEQLEGADPKQEVFDFFERAFHVKRSAGARFT